jgi:hypothetical protein
MTQDEVLKELHNVIAGNQQFTTWTVSTPHLVELVNRAVKAEREAIAQMVEPWLLPEYVKKIRARGQA